MEAAAQSSRKGPDQAGSALPGEGMQEDKQLVSQPPHRLPAQPVHLSLHVSLHYGFCAFRVL